MGDHMTTTQQRIRERTELNPEHDHRLTAEEINNEIDRLERGEPAEIPAWRYMKEIEILEAELAELDA